MKGLYSASDMYGPARIHYMDGAYSTTDWEQLFRSVGNQRKRLWFLGDRLLDRLEARMLRDQFDLPPGLDRLINLYRSLFHLQPIHYRTTQTALDGVFDVQARLVPKEVRTRSKDRLPRKRRV